MTKADICLSLGCRWFGPRADDQPAPSVCPKCGQDTLMKPPPPRPNLAGWLRAERVERGRGR